MILFPCMSVYAGWVDKQSWKVDYFQFLVYTTNVMFSLRRLWINALVLIRSNAVIGFQTSSGFHVSCNLFFIFYFYDLYVIILVFRAINRVAVTFWISIEHRMALMRAWRFCIKPLLVNSYFLQVNTAFETPNTAFLIADALGFCRIALKYGCFQNNCVMIQKEKFRRVLLHDKKENFKNVKNQLASLSTWLKWFSRPLYFKIGAIIFNICFLSHIILESSRFNPTLEMWKVQTN